MSDGASRHQKGGSARRFVVLLLLITTIDFIYRAQRLRQLHGVALLVARAMESM